MILGSPHDLDSKFCVVAFDFQAHKFFKLIEHNECLFAFRCLADNHLFGNIGA